MLVWLVPVAENGENLAWSDGAVVGPVHCTTEAPS